MGQVTLTLNGRSYRVGCGDGEEARLNELGDYVRQKVDDLTGEFGQVGEARLLLLAALLIADELFDTRAGKAPESSAAQAAALREVAGRVKVETKVVPGATSKHADVSAAAKTDEATAALSSLQTTSSRQGAAAPGSDGRKAG
jgi:cell division protein ZapA